MSDTYMSYSIRSSRAPWVNFAHTHRGYPDGRKVHGGRACAHALVKLIMHVDRMQCCAQVHECAVHMYVHASTCIQYRHMAENQLKKIKNVSRSRYQSCRPTCSHIIDRVRTSVDTCEGRARPHVCVHGRLRRSLTLLLPRIII
jgi:hypothetical protein